ncbi:hypothetical protein ACFWBB_32705 [Streptomyces sp. NPDC060000]|uniref:hypothetical protein n=1 Tax=Streptomyces sp. NPDC060000 TaxID=3347031 RepID=UPI0036B2BF28
MISPPARLRYEFPPRRRARVEDLPRPHGYRKRPAVSRSRASLLDLVFKDLGSPWGMEIIRGVEEVAHAPGVGTVVSATHDHSGVARQWRRTCAPAPPAASSSSLWL